jgi:hypothetical protein
MKLPRRTFLHLAAGRGGAARIAEHRIGARLSDAAGAHHRRFSARRRQ